MRDLKTRDEKCVMTAEPINRKKDESEFQVILADTPAFQSSPTIMA